MGSFAPPGLTFGDVLIVPQYSKVTPKDVSLLTRFSRRIILNVPVVSAAMDTVTEHRLAIALARAGGIGVVHRAMSVAAQVHEVAMVKRSQAGMIVKPLTLPPTATIADARRLMAETNVSGFPIVDQGRLVGIVTSRDLRSEEDSDETPLADIMTIDLVTAPPGVTMEEARRLLQSRRIEKLPIVDPEGRLFGLMTYKDMQKVYEHPNACRDSRGRLRVAAAVGVADGEERAAALVEAGVDALVVDSAHGHSENVLQLARLLVQQYQEVDVVAGNIATAEAAAAFFQLGVHGVKVGMGPGASCTTRIVSGCGVPQITAIMSVVGELLKHSSRDPLPVIADGGIQHSGDIVKAIAAGADCVMIGSLFAGTEESPGETILYEGRTYKSYRGMGSVAAMATKGTGDRYNQAGVTAPEKLVPEGIEGRVPYKGHLADLVYQLVGGLRSGMGYAGAANIQDLQESSVLMPISSASNTEGRPSVAMIKDAPNYGGR